MIEFAKITEGLTEKINEWLSSHKAELSTIKGKIYYDAWEREEGCPEYFYMTDTMESLDDFVNTLPNCCDNGWCKELIIGINEDCIYHIDDEGDEYYYASTLYDIMDIPYESMEDYGEITPFVFKEDDDEHEILPLRIGKHL